MRTLLSVYVFIFTEWRYLPRVFPVNPVLRCHHGAAPRARRLHASMRQSSVATAAALSRVPCSTGDFNLGKSQPLRYESEALDLFNNVFNGPQNTQVPKMTSKKNQKFVSDPPPPPTPRSSPGKKVSGLAILIFFNDSFYEDI